MRHDIIQLLGLALFLVLLPLQVEAIRSYQPQAKQENGRIANPYIILLICSAIMMVLVPFLTR